MRAALILGLFAALNFMDYSFIPGGDPFRNGKIRYLFLTISPLVFVFFRRYLTAGPAFFAALAVASFTVHDFPLHATMPLLTILAVMAGAVAIVSLGEEAFARLLVIGGFFQSVLALLQVGGFYVFFTPLLEKQRHIPVGLYGHETVLGPFLVACLAPAIWKKQYWAAVPIALAAILTVSSMTWAALGMLVLVYAWHLFGWRAPVLLAAAGPAVLAAAYTAFPDHPILSFNGRAVIWKYGWQAFWERPLMGHGVGAWAGEVLPRFLSNYAVELRTAPRQLHMDYLDFLVEYGVIGAVPLAGAAGLFLRNFRPSWTHAVCAAILVNSFANFPLCMPPIAMIFVACWAHSIRGATMGVCET